MEEDTYFESKFAGDIPTHGQYAPSTSSSTKPHRNSVTTGASKPRSKAAPTRSKKPALDAKQKGAEPKRFQDRWDDGDAMTTSTSADNHHAPNHGTGATRGAVRVTSSDGSSSSSSASSAFGDHHNHHQYHHPHDQNLHPDPSASSHLTASNHHHRNARMGGARRSLQQQQQTAAHHQAGSDQAVVDDDSQRGGVRAQRSRAQRVLPPQQTQDHEATHGGGHTGRHGFSSENRTTNVNLSEVISTLRTGTWTEKAEQYRALGAAAAAGDLDEHSSSRILRDMAHAGNLDKEHPRVRNRALHACS